MKQHKSLIGALLLGLVAGVGATSCSNDTEATPGGDNGNMITFSLNVETPSRAATLYTSTSLPAISLYRVWAYYTSETSGKPVQYFADKSLSGSAGAYVTGLFWPDHTLNFIALADHESNAFSWYGADGTTFGPRVTYSGKLAASEQHDLLYAVTAGEAPHTSASNPAVGLTSRHALAQVLFSAKVTRQDVRVTVRSVDIYNLNNTGVFTIDPAVTTTSTAGSVTWSDFGKTAADATTQQAFSTTFTTTPAIMIDTEASARPISEPLLLIPNDYSAQEWQTGTAPTANDVYLSIDCLVELLGTIQGGDNDGSQVSTTVKDGRILVPASLNIEQGKKYTYTLTFGSGSYGYEDNGTDPVLIPITYTRTVDDWIDGDSKNIDVQTDEDDVTTT